MVGLKVASTKRARGAAAILVVASVMAVFSLRGYAQWEPEMEVAPVGAVPALGASGRDVNVFWEVGGQIYCRRSADSGSSWSNPVDLAPGDMVGPDGSMAVDGSNVHVLFSRGNELYSKSSADAGLTWGQDLSVARLTSGTTFFRSSMGASGTRVDVSWTPIDGGTFTTDGMFYRRSTDGGNSWGPTVELVSAAHLPGRPNTSSLGENVFIVFGDGRDGFDEPCPPLPGTPEIYFKYSADGGETWGPDTRLSALPGLSNRPTTAAADPNIVLAVWEEPRDSIPGELELHVARSTDGGANWTRLSSSPLRPAGAPTPTWRLLGPTSLSRGPTGGTTSSKGRPTTEVRPTPECRGTTRSGSRSRAPIPGSAGSLLPRAMCMSSTTTQEARPFTAGARWRRPTPTRTNDGQRALTDGAAVGSYGILAHAGGQRAHEPGIPSALGLRSDSRDCHTRTRLFNLLSRGPWLMACTGVSGPLPPLAE